MSQKFVIKYKNGKEVELKSHHIHKGKEMIERSKDPTILNLDTYFTLLEKEKNSFNQDYYNKFKEFNNKVVKQVANEVDNNEGDIIQKHVYDNKYKKDIEEIFERYKTTYIDSISLTEPDIHMKTSDEKPYPLFQEDLYNKSENTYKNFEEKLGIKTKIEDQTDEQFVETLKKRREGLQKCLNEPTKVKFSNTNNVEYEKSIFKTFNNNLVKKYYENEYKTEQITNKDNKSNNIDKQCKVINYNTTAVKKIEEHKKLDSKTLERTLEYITSLFKTNENQYAKTFLPENFWIEGGAIKIDMIKDLIVNGDRDYIQYIFGFFSDNRIQHALDLRPLLYMAGGMMADYEYRHSCHPLVNWSILLNSLYSKCSTYNTVPKCFARFILPVIKETKDITKDTIKETIKDTYELQVYRQLLDLFNNNPETNTEFIGMITIKYLYDKEHDGHKFNEYRIWYLYVFKNNDFTKHSRLDLLTGKREEFFCVSQYLNYMNNGMLFGKDNVTYSELLFFEKLSKLNTNKKIYFYKTKYDDTMLFLSLKPNLEEDLFLKKYSSLDMKRVEIKIVDKDRKTDRKKYISLEYKTKMSGGFNSQTPDYKIITTNNEKKLYFNNTILSKNILKYKLLYKKVENIRNNYLNRTMFLNTITYLYKYLLISINESKLSQVNKFIKYIIFIT